MRSSRLNKIGVFTLLILIATLGSSCSLYRKVRARMSLVDGAQAYNQRNFSVAITDFQRAVSYDPEGQTLEGRTAQLFLARTLHSLYAGNRRDVQKAQQAIDEYKKALPEFIAAYASDKAAAENKPNDAKLQSALTNTESSLASIVSAVGSLYENLQQPDNWLAWEKGAAENTGLPNEVRSNSYVALAAKEYEKAVEITDSEAVKKTVTKDGKPDFTFVKPDDATFTTLKDAVNQGLQYAEQAVKLNDQSDSAWSYLASLQIEQARIAEMEGNTEQAASLEATSDQSKAKFEKLAEERRKKEEADAEAKAKAAGGEVKKGEDAGAEQPANK